MSVAGAAFIACAAMTFAAGSAAACGEQISGATRRIEGARYEIVFRSAPAPIETGKPFSLDFAVCPRGGAGAPDAVQPGCIVRMD